MNHFLCISFLAFLIVSSAAHANAALSDYDDTIRLHCIGDSITASGGPSYRPALHDLLEADGHDITFVGNFKIPLPGLEDNAHSALGGAEAWLIRENYLQDWVSAIPADIFLVHLGTNGPLGPDNTNVQDGAAEVGKVVDDILALQPEAEIYVAGVINTRNPGEIFTELAASIGDEVAARAALGMDVTFVDMSTLLSPEDYSDNYHPVASGFEKMGEKWYEALNADKVETPQVLAAPLPPAALLFLLASFGLLPPRFLRK
jgi:lysophospholipase L1-like esterase